MATNLEHGTLYYGDCLDWMREFPDDCVDLLYLDPPFNSNANYNMIFGESNGVSAQLRAFTDTWKWNAEAVERVQMIRNAVAHPAHRAIEAAYDLLGNSGMMSYLSYMAERLVEMKRLLKPTGSIYFHCDPTASHYIKIILDTIFGHKNFRNEIVWCYSRPSAPKQRQLSRVHDIIFWYSHGDNWCFNPDEIRQPYAPSSRAREGYSAAASKVAEGNVELHKDGKFPESWVYIPPVKGNSRESLSYPTQKPIALLERIIKAGSNKGDVVLDPFCGCGTTIEAAHKLGREWIGIDISSFAIDVVINRRLTPAGIASKYAGIPADLMGAKQLASDRPLDFETWAIQRVEGLAPNIKQVGDSGIDGRGKIVPQRDTDKSLISDDVIAQVKGGHFVLGQLRDFLHVVERDKVGFGIYITLEKVTSDKAIAEIAEFGKVKIGAKSYPRVQLWSIEEHFNGVTPDIPPLLDPYTGKQHAQDVKMADL